ncbi:HET-domain-containing protein, partial [Polyplosphaeria fusca]
MLHRCQQHHPQCRADRGFDFPQKAHVVDCKNRQIVPMIDGHDYLALSYVWGSESAGSRLKQPSNDEDFHLPPLLPQMVEDAIEVTIFLGYRYLWIDSVCINQSHTTEKAFQIQQMGNIYSHAVATICALGAHANVSLPGVSQDRRTSPFFQSQGSTYISLPEPDFLRRSLLQTAEWSKRAWTFQEAMLSRRCIFFTEEQVSLVC